MLDSRGSGYSSWIITGIDWVANYAATNEVAKMSLGGPGFNQAEYDAIQGVVNKGVAFAVAAGNDHADASTYSPASFDNVLKASALADFNGLPGGGASPTCRTDQDDTLADFSNWGPAIDLAAPGVCILSTYPLERGSYGTLSGTSMASPHVAGALALLASANNPNSAAAVYALYDQVIGTGKFKWIDDSNDGRQEALLDVGMVTAFKPSMIAGGGGNPAPENNITLTVRAYKVKANKKADLGWTGIFTASVDIYRNGLKLGSTANDGAYTDSLGKTVVSATYKVCESGTATCSNSVAVSW